MVHQADLESDMSPRLQTLWNQASWYIQCVPRKLRASELLPTWIGMSQGLPSHFREFWSVVQRHVHCHLWWNGSSVWSRTQRQLLAAPPSALHIHGGSTYCTTGIWSTHRELVAVWPRRACCTRSGQILLLMNNTRWDVSYLFDFFV